MLKKIPKALFYVLLIMLFIILFFVMLNVTAEIRGVIFRSLRPIFYGTVIAYLFKPMCNYFDKRYMKLFSKKLTHPRAKKLSHYLSMLTTYIIYGTVIYFLLSIIVPQLAKSIVQLVSSIPAFYTSFMEFLRGIVVNNPFLMENIEVIMDAIYNGFNSWYQTSLGPLISNITGGVMVTFTFIINLVIGIIVSVYLLNGRKKFCAQAKLIIKSIFPKSEANMIFDEARFADKMFSGYFAGTLIDSALVALICYLLCLISGMPFPILVSVIVGTANIIPFFGPYIGMIPSAIIILTVSPIKALIFVFMIWLLQQVDGNIIAPKIIGSNTGLSSFWVLFAILLFGGLFGFFGMIIGSPIFAVIYDIIGKLIRRSMKKKGEHDFLEGYEREFLLAQPKTQLKSGFSLFKGLFKSKKRGKNSGETAKAEKNCDSGGDNGFGTEAADTDCGFSALADNAFSSERSSDKGNGGVTETEGSMTSESDEGDMDAEEENLQISFF